MRYIVTIIIALIIVAASFLYSRALTMESLTGKGSIFDTFETVDGTWLYSDKIGASVASDVERARVAINGPLGLSSKEAIYFVALQDKDGEPLQSHCTYRVSGQSMDTRWWSLTLYDSLTQHYVPNVENRSSWNSVSVPKTDTGEWVINVSPTPKDPAWLPSQENPEQSFDLMLRVYNPSEAMRAVIPNIPLPSVERVSC